MAETYKDALHGRFLPQSVYYFTHISVDTARMPNILKTPDKSILDVLDMDGKLLSHPVLAQFVAQLVNLSVAN